MSLKTILGWLAVAFIVWWIIEQPDGASHIVHNIGIFLTTVASGLSHFFSSIGGPSGPPSKKGNSWMPVAIGAGGLAGLFVIAVGGNWLADRLKARKKRKAAEKSP